MLRSNRPVLVVGSPRSGTTFLHDTLLSSGGFAIYDQETHVFSGLVTRVGNLAERQNREKLIAIWLKSKYFKPIGVDVDEVKERVLEECRNGGDFLRIVMENMARRQNVNRWAEHTPDHVLYLQEIRRTLPDALILHIIRDGRDVALSLDRQGFLLPYVWNKRQSLMVCGIYWEWVVGAGTRDGLTLGPDYLEVRYEDLIKTPRETLARIGQFIDHDLDYDRIQQTRIGSVAKPNTSFGNNSHDTGFNPIGRWAKAFPPGELARFEGLIGPFLSKMGYPLASSEKEVPNTLELARLRAFYRSYFSLRLFVKSHQLPIAKYFVRDRE